MNLLSYLRMSGYYSNRKYQYEAPCQNNVGYDDDNRQPMTYRENSRSCTFPTLY